MSEFLYRFRSTNALLGKFEELERQEIFFASPDELNDPLEGFTNIVWQGDAILWRNLLGHYLLCLLEAAMHVTTMGAEFRPAAFKLRVQMTDADLPEAPIRAIYAAIRRYFLEHSAPNLFIAEADRHALKLNREGLSSYLRLLQPVAMRALLKALADDGLHILKPGADLDTLPPDLTDQLRTMLEAHAELGADAELLLSVGERMGSQIALIDDYSRTNQSDLAGFTFLCRDFPRHYIDALERLMFPGWFAACFVAEPANAAMWGIYGDGHRGACLQFRTQASKTGKRSLTLGGNFSAPHDPGAPHKTLLDLDFEQVRYADEYPEIDFFATLGRLSRAALSGFWYAGEDGRRSAKGDRILSESAEWRRDYWATHSRSSTTKLPQWAHEAEQRLVLTWTLDDLADPASRKLKYRTEDLAGIVFGMKMDHADKLAIMGVIDRKLTPEQRRHFTFYQASYSHRAKRVEHRPLGLLTPKP